MAAEEPAARRAETLMPWEMVDSAPQQPAPPSTAEVLQPWEMADSPPVSTAAALESSGAASDASRLRVEESFVEEVSTHIIFQSKESGAPL